jgi:hypothetical protein
MANLIEENKNQYAELLESSRKYFTSLQTIRHSEEEN